MDKEYDIKKSGLEEVEKLIKDQSIKEIKQEIADLKRKVKSWKIKRNIYWHKTKTEEEIKKLKKT